MTRKRVICAALSVVAALGGYGIGVYSRPDYLVQPLGFDQVPNRARLYDGAVLPELFVGEVEVGELLRHMRRAAWTNAHIMRKGAWTLETSDNTRVCVSYYGDFFWVRGRPGYFLVPELERPAFGKLVEERLSSPTIEWRGRRNAEGKDAPRRSASGGCSDA